MSGMAAFTGARDIRDAVRQVGGRVGLATVYRHLRLLAEEGSVDTIHGPGGQTLYRLRRDDCTHHLTCRACGQAVEVDGHEVREWAAQAVSLAGFTLTGYTVELAGLCPLHAGSSQEAGAPGTRWPAGADDGRHPREPPVR
jgi:Fur family ferric uptake transcriptional regulator